MASKRVAMSQVEALWLFGLIQRMAVEDLLAHKNNTQDYQQYVELVKRIKHIAEV